VPSAGSPWSAMEQELRDHVRQNLPPYMIPSVFVRLAELPLTSSGKIDVNALPEPAPPSAGPRRAEPAADPLEAAVAEIFGEVLGIGDVDPAADFFRLGGTSLGVVRVLVALRERLAHPVSAVHFYRGPTVNQLAEVLRAGRQRDGC
jgi:acyl carrier protein